MPDGDGPKSIGDPMLGNSWLDGQTSEGGPWDAGTDGNDNHGGRQSNAFLTMAHKVVGVAVFAVVLAAAIGMLLQMVHESLVLITIPVLASAAFVSWNNWHLLRAKLAWLWLTSGLLLVVGIAAPPETSPSETAGQSNTVLTRAPTATIQQTVAPTSAPVSLPTVRPTTVPTAVVEPTVRPTVVATLVPEPASVSSPPSGLTPPARATSGFEADMLWLSSPDRRAEFMVDLFELAAPRVAPVVTEDVLLDLWKGTCLDFDNPVIAGGLDDVFTGLTESYFQLFELTTTPLTRAETGALVVAAVGTGCPIWLDEVIASFDRNYVG